MLFWHELGEEITGLTSPPSVILPGGAFRQHLQTRPVQLAGIRVADLLYGLWIGRCEGGRRVKVPGRGNQREETASQGRRAPLTGFSQTGEPRVCPSLSPQWRGHFPGPLWFLSITYQLGQSVAEIKQLLKPDGL